MSTNPFSPGNKQAQPAVPSQKFNQKLQPEYTPPDSGRNKAVLIADRDKVILDANAKESGHVLGRFTNEDGEVKDIQVPRLPYEKWIDPAGNVVSMPVKNNRVFDSTESPYKSWITAKKLRKGWVKYDSMPEAEREKLIDARKAQRRKEAARYDKAYRAQEERMFEAIKLGNQEALAQVIEQIANATAGKSKKGSGPAGE